MDQAAAARRVEVLIELHRCSGKARRAHPTAREVSKLRR